MCTAFIEVDGISPGMFESERIVIFMVRGKQYEYICSSRALNGFLLEVQVIGEDDCGVWIQPPGDSFAGPRRLCVPPGMIEQVVVPISRGPHDR